MTGIECVTDNHVSAQAIFKVPEGKLEAFKDVMAKFCALTSSGTIKTGVVIQSLEMNKRHFLIKWSLSEESDRS